jgi:hypothetical protein
MNKIHTLYKIYSFKCKTRDGGKKGVTKDHKGIITRMHTLVMATVFGGRNPMNRTMR